MGSPSDQDPVVITETAAIEAVVHGLKNAMSPEQGPPIQPFPYCILRFQFRPTAEITRPDEFAFPFDPSTPAQSYGPIFQKSLGAVSRSEADRVRKLARAQTRKVIQIDYGFFVERWIQDPRQIQRIMDTLAVLPLDAFAYTQPGSAPLRLTLRYRNGAPAQVHLVIAPPIRSGNPSSKRERDWHGPLWQLVEASREGFPSTQ